MDYLRHANINFDKNSVISTDQEQGNGLEFYEMVELITGFLTPELP